VDNIVGGTKFVECAFWHHQLDKQGGVTNGKIELDETSSGLASHPNEFGQTIKIRALWQIIIS
jgi:hypothetical protein